MSLNTTVHPQPLPLSSTHHPNPLHTEDLQSSMISPSPVWTGISKPFPSQPFPVGPSVAPFGSPRSDWLDSIQKAKREFDNLEIIQRQMDQFTRPNSHIQFSKNFALLCENADNVLGVRHFFRMALSESDQATWLRCWGVILERKFDQECLLHGISETLMSASLGQHPKAALEWLYGLGFRPPQPIIHQALLTCLAFFNPTSRMHTLSQSIITLVELYHAGSLQSDITQTLDSIKKGLGSQARSHAEAYEISLIAFDPLLTQKKSRL